jgi:hypothetical protein
MSSDGRLDNGTRGETCESVVWRELDRRCELWMINGSGCLRLFEGDRMLTEEPVLQGAVWAQAIALRTWTPRRHRRRQFGSRD